MSLVISFTEDDNNVAQIAEAPQHDSTIIDSAMNNSGIQSAEVMPKDSDTSNDSITSGNMLNDDGNSEEIIILSFEEASNASVEEFVTINDGEKSDQLKNDAGEGLESGESQTQKSLIDGSSEDDNRGEIATDEVAFGGNDASQTNDVQVAEGGGNAQKPKGAVAKSKIPAKVKVVDKRKNSAAKAVVNEGENSQRKKSTSTSPEK